jgi:1,4-dihydroxy-2-naphthoyl-CoA hydrolase
VSDGSDGARGATSQPAPWDRATLPSPLIPLERTFEGFLGLEWLELTLTSAHVRFEVRENLKQPLGLLHGGIYSAVAETIASVATVNAVWKDGFVGAGLSNYASFLRPITAGPVDVTAILRGHNEREWTWGHEFSDECDNLCALVDVTIAVRPAPAGNRPRT